MKFRIFNFIGGQIRCDDGSVLTLKPWWPFMMITAIASFFGVFKLSTSILVNQTFNGIGKADQKITISMVDPKTFRSFWGINLTIDQARFIANRINTICDRLEEYGIK